MSDEKRFLVDVGIKDLPFPMKVNSRAHPDGQATVANITISARIMKEFEARGIDSFIQILHRHRDRIGTKWISANIRDYMEELQASMVKTDFNYPFFVEKATPVSKEKCLVRYMCTHSSKVSAVFSTPKSFLRMEVPCFAAC